MTTPSLIRGYNLRVLVMQGFGGDPIQAAEAVYLAWSESFAPGDDEEARAYAVNLRMGCLVTLESMILPLLRERAQQAVSPTWKKLHEETANVAADTVRAWLATPEIQDRIEEARRGQAAAARRARAAN